MKGTYHSTFQAEFSIISEGDNYVILQDEDGAKSVTNDIDRVYGILLRQMPNLVNQRIFYFDSYGDSAEIIAHGSFIRIDPLPYKTIEELKEYVVFGALQ